MRAQLVGALLLALVLGAYALDADPRGTTLGIDAGCIFELLDLLHSSWGKDKGLKVNKIDFIRVTQGEGRLGLRGLVTTQPKGEAIIHVPPALALHVGKMKGVPKGPTADLSRMVDSESEVATQQHFMAFMLIAMMRNATLHAYWAPWLATWPRQVHNPYSFTEVEMDELRATDPTAWEEAKWLRRIMTWNFDYLMSILSNPHNPKVFDPPVTITEFAQAYTWAMTRDFAVHGEADERAAILPIADYVNHKNGRETVNLIEIEDGSYEIQAIYPLEPGTEITVMYGKLSNAALVNYWGFVMPDNKLDTVALDVAIPANAPLASEKQRVLLEYSDRLIVRPKEADYALPLLRILSSDAPDTFEEDNIEAYLSGFLKGTRDEERKTLAYAVSICDAMLVRLSSVPENTPLAAKGNITDNVRVIMEYRREVKKMVTRIRDIFEGMETVKSVGATAPPSGMDVEEAEYARESIDEEGNVIVD